MKTRTLSLLLAVALCLSLVPHAFAADVIASRTGSNTTWTLTRDGTLTFSCKDGNGWTTDIDEQWRELVRTVVIEPGIYRIASLSFANMPNLTSVSIPNTVAEIDGGAFLNCTALTSVSIPGGTFLKERVAGNDIYGGTTVKSWAFAGCTSLSKVELGQIYYIDNEAFLDCTSLTSLTIPASYTDSLRDKGYSTYHPTLYFTGTALERVDVAPGNQVFASVDGVVFNKAKTELLYYPSGRPGDSYEIPKGVKTIDEHAFVSTDTVGRDSGIPSSSATRTDHVSRPAHLTSLTVPAGVTSITHSVFYKYDSLVSVSLPGTVTTIGYGAFRGCTSLTGLELPKGVTEIGDTAFSGCTSLTELELPSTVTSIGYSAFQGCTSLTKVSIPQGVIGIEEYTFDGCSSLTEVTLPDSVASIGDYAFRNCAALPRVELPSGLVFVGNNAFEKCAALTQVDFPEGLLRIGGSAFSGCASLAAAELPDSVNFLGEEAFLGCTSLGKLSLPAGLTTVPKACFSGCTSLPEVAIPAGVTAIGQNAFSGCAGLTALSLPENVATIEDNAFSGCAGLTALSLPENVATIEDNAFSGCTGLTTVTVPAVELGRGVFSGCTGLTSAVLAQGATKVADGTFSGCSNLASVTIPRGVTEIGGNAFTNCAALPAVTVPEGVTVIKGRAFAGCESLAAVSLPASLESIWYGAFDKNTDNFDYSENYANSKLADVYYGGTQEQWSAVQIADDYYEMSDRRSNAPLFRKDLRFHYGCAAPSGWAAGEVSAAVEAGLAPAGLQQFYPVPVTRAAVAEMFVSLLEQASGKTIDEILAEKGVTLNQAAFVDTTDKSVLACNALGIINGTDLEKRTFSPGMTLSRAQAAAIINRAARVLGQDTSGSYEFNDTKGHWVSAELGWPVKNEVLKGEGNGNFNPNGDLTTEQAILIAYRALEAMK